MNTAEGTPTEKPVLNFRTAAGALLVAAGAVLFLDRYLQTGWLSLLVLPFSGLVLYVWGVRARHAGLLAIGGLAAGAGIGLLLALNPAAPVRAPLHQAGLTGVFFALGCGLVLLTTAYRSERPAWWALLAGGAVGGIGLALLQEPVRPFTLLLYAGLGVGLPLLLWGLAARLYGLVIAGCLITTIAAGLYLAWGFPRAGNALLRTGIMLLGFSSGWALITAFARLRFQRSAWWPLIPGGILATVGFGLYVGGDPTNALGIIGNTGSIALMIFGLYLLLMRKGIRS